MLKRAGAQYSSIFSTTMLGQTGRGEIQSQAFLQVAKEWISI
jgi:hypothetical protein